MLKFETLTRGQFRYLAAAFLTIIVTTTAIVFSHQQAQAAGKVKMVAIYRGSIVGLGFAKIYFDSIINGDDYSLKVGGENRSITRLLGKVKAVTTSTGKIVGNKPVPKKHHLSIRNGDEQHKVDFSYSGNSITGLSLNPPAKSGPERVPVNGTHKKNVLDPLSAMFLPLPDGKITGRNTCNRRVPVFDGHYRYDLVMSFKRTERVPSQGKSGKLATAIVCKIQYKPLAGHKPKGKSNAFWTQNQGMEIWMSPIRRVGIFVPIKIITPTPLGTAVVNLTSLDISGDIRQASVQ